LIKQIGEQLMSEEPYQSAILAPLEILGVDTLGDDYTVIIKARFKTMPIKQWMVGREMNRRIKKRLEEADIQVPHPTQIIQLPPDVLAGLRSELKQVVREVLKET
jgi:small conductance mechanosensitive channel